MASPTIRRMSPSLRAIVTSGEARNHIVLPIPLGRGGVIVHLVIVPTPCHGTEAHGQDPEETPDSPSNKEPEPELHGITTFCSLRNFCISSLVWNLFLYALWWGIR